MNISKQALISAVLGVLFLSPPAFADDDLKLVGLWKIVSFQTEDVQAKTLNNIYGAHPFGYMQVTRDGRFSAFVFSNQPEPVQSVWEDAARALSGQAAIRSGIIYSGKYRLEGNKFIINVERARHEGWVGLNPFDMSWNEGRTLTEEVRYYRLESDSLDSDLLRVETPHIANPNGAGNIIIGRIIWERISKWEGQ
jgi:hypothetical protein